VAGQKKSFLLRIDPQLWEELNRWAAADLRSVNGQIEFILRRAVDQRRRRPSALSDPPAGLSPASEEEH
jgi:hypothetical protein